MRIRDIITPTLFVRHEEPAEAALEKMRTAGIEYALVVRDGSIIGVLSQEELHLRCESNGATQAGELATSVPALAPDASIKEAANLMRSRRVRCLPVIDDGIISGVVTADRLLELIARGVIHALPNREHRVLRNREPKRQYPPKKRAP